MQQVHAIWSHGITTGIEEDKRVLKMVCVFCYPYFLCARKWGFVHLMFIMALLQTSCSLIDKDRYIIDSTGLSECVADIVPAKGVWDCTLKAAARDSYAYVYVDENHTCHICVPAREIGNRTSAPLPTSGTLAYQRGMSNAIRQRTHSISCKCQ